MNAHRMSRSTAPVFRRVGHISPHWVQITLLLLTVLLSTHGIAQTDTSAYTLSDRVGPEIDPIECDFFGLFPGISDFRSARAFRQSDGSIDIVIRYGNPARETILRASTEQAEELRRLVETDELGFHDRNRIRWDILAGLARPVARTAEDAVRATVTTASEDVVTGTLLHVSDDRIMLWTAQGPYDWRQAPVSALVLSARSVRNIVLENEGYFWSGAAYGALVAGGTGAILGLAAGDTEGMFGSSAGRKASVGGIGLGLLGGLAGGILGATAGIDESIELEGDEKTLSALATELNERAVFRGSAPPELARISTWSGVSVGPGTGTGTTAPETRSVTAIFDIPLHISIAGGWVGSASRADIVAAFNESGFGGSTWGFFGPITYPIESPERFGWSVAAEYDIADRLRIGMVWIDPPDVEIRGSDEEVERARISSAGLLLEYVLVPVDASLLNRYEFAFAAGVTYNWLEVDGSLGALFGSAYSSGTTLYAARKRVAGGLIRGSLDYYLFSSVSLQGSVVMRYVPGIPVQAVTHVNTYNNQTKSLRSHTVRFSGLDVLVAVRLHL